MVDFFEWPEDPVLYFDCAKWFQHYFFEMNGEKYSWLIFGRPDTYLDFEGESRPDGVTLAIFHSDADGAVDWSQRFEMSGKNFDFAFAKFRYLWVNNLIEPVARPVAIPEADLARLDSMVCSSADEDE